MKWRNITYPAIGVSMLPTRLRRFRFRSSLGEAATAAARACTSLSSSTRLVLCACLPDLLDSSQALGGALAEGRGWKRCWSTVLGRILLEQRLQALAQLLGILDRDSHIAGIGCCCIQLLHAWQQDVSSHCRRLGVLLYSTRDEQAQGNWQGARDPNFMTRHPHPSDEDLLDFDRCNPTNMLNHYPMFEVAEATPLGPWPTSQQKGVSLGFGQGCRNWPYHA